MRSQPELALVVLSAREWGCSPVFRYGLIKECSDAFAFRQTCILQKVVSLVYATLSRAAVTENSRFLKTAVIYLRQDWWRWLRHRQRVLAAISVVRTTLNASDCRFLFMRGIPFAKRYYMRPRLRVCGDVDLLIPEEDRYKVESALMDAGFRLHPCKALHDARVNYVGQTEFRHPELRMLVDVNWLFTGNGGIGKVSQDMDLVWGRARHVAGAEWRLSHEDEFLNLVRHLGHGHDFDTGMLQVCVDAAAMLRVCGNEMDWDYVYEQAEASEFLRILRFFSYFFDEYYRDESMPCLGDFLPRLRASATDRECRLFSRIVLFPLLRRTSPRKAAFGVFYGNYRVAAKLWALDRFTRMLRMLAWAAWPSRHQLVMITLEYHTESFWKRRLRYYLNPLLPGLPGLSRTPFSARQKLA